VSKSQAEYLRPLTCGDKISVTLTPTLLGPDTYAISFELHRLGPPQKLAARCGPNTCASRPVLANATLSRGHRGLD